MMGGGFLFLAAAVVTGAGDNGEGIVIREVSKLMPPSSTLVEREVDVNGKLLCALPFCGVVRVVGGEMFKGG
jgi:hypothetical protein